MQRVKPIAFIFFTIELIHIELIHIEYNSLHYKCDVLHIILVYLGVNYIILVYLGVNYIII